MLRGSSKQYFTSKRFLPVARETVKRTVATLASMELDVDYISPNLPSRCTWHKGVNPADSPHTKQQLKPKSKILPDIIYGIGETPVVKLNRIPQAHGIKCEILAKCEFLNPGGSLKDRICPRMVEDMEKAGLIKPGCTLIAPTSGNTGIGICMFAAVRGYRCIIVMPEKMSAEKEDTMRSLGAEIIRTPTAASWDSPLSSFAVAQKLEKEIPNSVVVDQYRTASNPLAHYDITAEEIIEQCDGKLDMIVIGAGTGGTLTGIGRKIKEKMPQCIVVAVEPEGSIMSDKDIKQKKFFEVEGIGHDFAPTVLDSEVADEWYKPSDKDSFVMCRQIIKDEGLLVGGSCGTVMVGALQAAAKLSENQRCLVLFPDSIRNYMTKFLSDKWMIQRNFMEDATVDPQWWSKHPVAKLEAKKVPILHSTATVQDAAKAMKEGNHSYCLIKSSEQVVGALSQQLLLEKILAGRLENCHGVDRWMITNQKIADPTASLGSLCRFFERDGFVVLTNHSLVEKDAFFNYLFSAPVVNGH